MHTSTIFAAILAAFVASSVAAPLPVRGNAPAMVVDETREHGRRAPVIDTPGKGIIHWENDIKNKRTNEPGDSDVDIKNPDADFHPILQKRIVKKQKSPKQDRSNRRRDPVRGNSPAKVVDAENSEGGRLDPVRGNAPTKVVGGDSNDIKNCDAETNPNQRRAVKKKIVGSDSNYIKNRDAKDFLADSDTVRMVPFP
ncbi:UNVERIFIED_CONTAM: hypothetical protein HDU68_011971 [Siphonaria sp. JEL0065]|nr:hypothetical protein HDU68_011971 [Siphonaria sp. JEL0065]